MKRVTTKAVYDFAKCTGCHTCTYVCPFYVVTNPSERPLEREQTPPCRNECLCNNDVEGFLTLTGQGKFHEAWNLIRQTNPFPSITGRVCYAHCEKNCNRAEFDEAIATNAVERFLGDLAHEKGWKSSLPSEKRKEKIAVLGAGPAGLSCAFYAALQGYRPVVFEEKRAAGGMLQFGIPDYRLPKPVLDREIQQLEEMGVEFKSGQTMGKDFTFQDIEKNYDALFIATGCPKSRNLNIQGEDLPQVRHDLTFLEEVNTGKRPAVGKCVAIIGGGNTAVDTARSALRLGAEEVHLICLESREEMPACKEEIEEAAREGVQIHVSLGPKKFIEQGGRIAGVETLRCSSVFDDQRRFNPVLDLGTESVLPCDMVIVAIGASSDMSVLPREIPKVNGRIQADDQMFTGIPKVYSGGDIVTGPAFVSKAIGMGRRAAQAINNHLEKSPAGSVQPIKVVFLKDMNVDYFDPLKRVLPGFEWVPPICCGWSLLAEVAAVSEAKS